MENEDNINPDPKRVDPSEDVDPSASQPTPSAGQEQGEDEGENQ
ncbi:MAG TPA: hypothetical protein VFS10_03440 [Pyrinomonadaceae bacterium]|nr:hypothetical protein [Pyrinomonadaceae bacterium]